MGVDILTKEEPPQKQYIAKTNNQLQSEKKTKDKNKKEIHPAKASHSKETSFRERERDRRGKNPTSEPTTNY